MNMTKFNFDINFVRYGHTVQRGLGGLGQCLSLANPSSIPKTIVFFGNKKQLVQLYTFLRNRARKRHYIGAYHALLTSEMKQFVLQQFMTMRILCSTIVFGMVPIDYVDFFKLWYSH